MWLLVQDTRTEPRRFCCYITITGVEVALAVTRAGGTH